MSAPELPGSEFGNQHDPEFHSQTPQICIHASTLDFAEAALEVSTPLVLGLSEYLDGCARG